MQNFFLILLLIAWCSGVMAESKVIVFPWPEDARVPPSEFYSVDVNGQKPYVYRTWRADKNSEKKISGCKVSPLSFTVFDFEGEATVTLTLQDGILRKGATPVVRPLACGIKPEVTGNQVRFTLRKPGNYTFDPRGDGYNAIHLFTNVPETDIPDRNDKNVLYYGPGVHKLATLRLKAGQTLYLAGGAVLQCEPVRLHGTVRPYPGIEVGGYSEFVAADGSDITIRGRGIISLAGLIEEKKRTRPLRIYRSENSTIRDVVLLGGSDWNLTLFGCRNVTIDNLRIVSFYLNSDGICPASNCDNIRITGCFVHNGDDALEVKSMDGFYGGYVPPGPEQYFGPVTNVTFENCIVWNDFAAPIGLTHEIVYDVGNVAFKGITVLHHTSPGGPASPRGQIALFAQGGGKVSNILFENIVVESSDTAYPQCVSVTNAKIQNPTFSHKPFSSLENIVFRNIRINTRQPVVSLYNDGADGLVKNILFDNVWINGKKLGTTQIKNHNASYFNPF